MKTLKLFTVLAVAVALGCEEPTVPNGIDDCGSVFECHTEAIQEATERLAPGQELVIVRSSIANEAMDSPFTRALYAPLERTDLGGGWVMYALTVPEWLRSAEITPETALDHFQEHEPVCDIVHYYRTPRILRGERWRRFGNFMADYATKHCGHETRAEFSQHFFYNEGDPDVEGDEQWDVHGYVTCIVPN